MPGRVVYTSNSNASRNKGSSRRTAEAGRLYSKTESVRISDASRDALQRTSRRPRPRSSPGYYSLPQRPDPALIPPYEDFLNEARARVSYHDVELVDFESKPTFRPDPYLDGYPSGYYNTELRSQRTGQSSTLVGTESTTSSTLVDSARVSFDRPVPARFPRRQARVQWGPVYQCVEPPIVSPNPLDLHHSISGYSSLLAYQHGDDAPEEATAPSLAQITTLHAPEPDLNAHKILSNPFATLSSLKQVNVSPSKYSNHKTYAIPFSNDTTVMATAIATIKERNVHPAQRHARCHALHVSKKTSTPTRTSTHTHGQRVDRSRKSQSARVSGFVASPKQSLDGSIDPIISTIGRSDQIVVEAQEFPSKFSPDSSPECRFSSSVSKTWNRVKRLGGN